jgi:hypothetical protein
VTSQITEAAAVSVSSIQRASYFAALSVAEQIMSVTTVLPTSVDVQVYPWSPAAPQVSFHFHRDVESMRMFAAEQQLSVSEVTRGNGAVYTEAVRLDARGVRVVAWTLSEAAPPAVAA